MPKEGEQLLRCFGAAARPESSAAAAGENEAVWTRYRHGCRRSYWSGWPRITCNVRSQRVFEKKLSPRSTR